MVGRVLVALVVVVPLEPAPLVVVCVVDLVAVVASLVLALVVVVGIAGSDEKCAWLVEELGFDAAVNYRTEDVAARLRELCPDGIDVYFDNVGGKILDICLGQLALKARVVCCGAISAYNDDRSQAYGLKNYFALITRRARMEGFLVLDYLPRAAEAQADLLTWVLEGKLQHTVHVVEGLEHSVEALNLLFTGGNTGKVIVHVAD